MCCIHCARAVPSIRFYINHIKGICLPFICAVLFKINNNTILQLVLVDTELNGQRCVRIWVPLHVATVVHQLQAEIGGRTALALIYVQGVQHVHR